MNASRKAVRLQQLLRILLVLALVALLGYAADRYKTSLDWTYGGRNTLTEASQRLLERMPEPIVFTAFVPESGELKRDILADIDRYRRVKSNIEVRFVDPSREPQKAREAGVRAFNEVQVSYQGQSELLRSLTEPAVTAALQRIADPASRLVLFLQGHGEKRIDGGDPMSMTRLAESLRESGLGVRSFNFATDAEIPDDATVMVLASPQRALLAGEQERLAQWLADGGNLVWLSDPDSPADFEPLLDLLGLRWHEGVAVFPDFEATSGHPGIFLAAGYPPNPVTARLDDITVFPLVRAIDDEAVLDSDWRAMPFLVTNRSAWLETGPIEGDLTLDEAAGDIPGPLTVGLTLSRELPAPSEDSADGGRRQQRVVLLGDSDFLTDVYFGEVGNQTLASNLFQWAATRDRQLDITIPKAPDSSLRLPDWAFISIAAGFVLGLPLLLVAAGVLRWLIRRRR